MTSGRWGVVVSVLAEAMLVAGCGDSFERSDSTGDGTGGAGQGTPAPGLPAGPPPNFETLPTVAEEEGVVVAQQFSRHHKLDTLQVYLDNTDRTRAAADTMAGAIERAMRAAQEQGVAGKALTPFLLTQIAQSTEGVSVEANVAFLKNNAAVAARIAGALGRKQ